MGQPRLGMARYFCLRLRRRCMEHRSNTISQAPSQQCSASEPALRQFTDALLQCRPKCRHVDDVGRVHPLSNIERVLVPERQLPDASRIVTIELVDSWVVSETNTRACMRKMEGSRSVACFAFGLLLICPFLAQLELAFKTHLDRACEKP